MASMRALGGDASVRGKPPSVEHVLIWGTERCGAGLVGKIVLVGEHRMAP